MAILSMRKLTVCALKKDRKALLETLQRLGTVEVLDLSENDENIRKIDTFNMRSIFEKNKTLAQNALEILEKYMPEEKVFLGSIAGQEKISKENYYLDIAQTVSERSTCLRRRFGAIIVKNDSIIATGYNGAPRGRKNCDDLGYCFREKLGIPRGERYEMCRSVHAEANAIIAAPREQMLGSTLYMVCTSPVDGAVMPGTTSCMMCKKLAINAGIERLVVRDDAENFRVINVSDWIEDDDSLAGKFGY